MSKLIGILGNNVKKIDIPTVFLFSYAVILLCLSTLGDIVISGLAGLLLIVPASILNGLRGGMLSALWASFIIFITAFVSNVEINIINITISVLFYYFIGAFTGKSVDIIRGQHSELQRFQAAINSSADNIFVVDPFEMRFIDVNRTACENLGYSKTELLRMGPQDIKPYFSSAQLSNEFRKIISGENGKSGKASIETVHRCKDGTEFFVEVFLETFKDQGKTLIIASARNITSRKQDEERIKKIFEEYEKVFHGTQAALFLVEVTEKNKFRYIRNNKAHEKATGISAEYIRGKTPQELVVENLGRQIIENYYQCVKTASSFSYEEALELPGGEKLWDTTLTPVFKEGDVTYIVGSSQDITERRQTEEQLWEKTSQLESFFNVALDLLCIADTNGNFIKVNKAWEEILGYPTIELEKKKFLDFIHPDDIESTREAII